MEKIFQESYKLFLLYVSDIFLKEGNNRLIFDFMIKVNGEIFYKNLIQLVEKNIAYYFLFFY